MANEQAKAQLAGLVDEVTQQFREIARIQDERNQLTASATVRRKRVTVTVNADGAVIETKFGPNIEELTYPEIAAAVTEAAQKATAEVMRKGQQLMSPLDDRRARLPKLSDLIDGMPDLTGHLPAPQRASTASPAARNRALVDDGSAAVEFENAEVLNKPDEDGGVTASGW
ncbi:YbaB/EbfC family nucleoid-associated protein [Nocardia cyriacigeorgica]|uniref:YbaB/EbfC family nucleoid-associated protein n=1 Tax=Nocardia cyriacigeorgica TaxID=135487 RepID=UPI0013B6A670|nr:YbaB/EbfC family nucleoid-associated protein [Nocardia cyriacigeorgica]NEW39042.1 YbaB/EbfC family nucleoid-associated protein [Nocardia cyriacigeorgica]NEW50231.1 YbaB/EbfC family nucleoid-associated protein [Nocardia cyriacigeorgica]